MNETARLIYAYFDAFNQNMPEDLVGLLSDDVVHEINEGGVEIGREAFRKFKTHMDRCYRETIRDLVVMVNGGTGAAEFWVDGSYIHTDGALPEATGQSYSIRAAAIFEVKGGRITRVTSHYNLRAWTHAIHP